MQYVQFIISEQQTVKNQIHETNVKIRSLVHYAIILPISFQIMGGRRVYKTNFQGPQVEEIYAAFSDAKHLDQPQGMLSVYTQ